ncbi:hypothetical protein HK097_007969 [Rhizophlyctis rosea]|uniref:Pitrilysin n=1 Tax=Rhizophlyctis rosea TaxID=64517 RepID=A0AAD5X7Y7_9FUNG|nr:hypothetical protein HK097_007969 [Rhizophlyctis rosea]
MSTSAKIIPTGLDLAILTPQLKHRRIEKVVLQNGLKGIVISDPTTPTTGAALSVEAGSWSDGRHEGTAHFLEHMLFLGTKKYPSESEYERYIFDSNGILNGYTAPTHSLYYFSGVHPERFDGALDRFSRFFYEPLFNESCVDREMNAVDQEFRKNIEQDGWRILHVRKELAHQTHPYASFNTGNLETMKLIDRDYLIDWFKQNYTANTMNFALLGRDPAETLIAKAEAAFSPIPVSKHHMQTSAGSAIFPESLQRTVTWIQPLKDFRELTISWEIPYKFNDDDSKPSILVSHALGHEGKGSLLSNLKAEGLAEGLSAGKNHAGWDNLMFEVSVSLTEKGAVEWRTVVGKIFEAIDSFKQSKYPKNLYDEINLLNKIGYQYQQRSSGIATSYCKMLRKEGIDSFPRRSYFIDKFDSEAAHELLQELQPSSAMFLIVSQKPEIELNKTEKWMGAQYGVQELTKEIAEWEAVKPHVGVQYPAPNEFVPSNLQLVTPETAVVDPTKLIDGDAGSLYFYADTEFRVPEASYMFVLKTPAIRPGNARSLCLSELYLRFVNERLSELSYDASAAGLHYDVWIHKGTGIGLSVDGYSEKSHTLLASVLERLKHPRFTEDEFKIFKNSLSRSYKNVEKDSPLRQAMERFSNILYKEFATSKELAQVIDTLGLSDLTEFSSHLFDKRYIEAFIGGNAVESDARKAWELVNTELKGVACSKALVKKSETYDLPNIRPTSHSLEVPVKGNAVVWALVAGEKTNETRTGQEILSKLMKEPFYSELRTKQQTGYIVSSGGFHINKTVYVQASVQSNSHDARDLLARIELFQESFLRDLNESNDVQERFDSIKTSILARLKQPYDTLSSKLRFYNYLAYEEDAAFDMIQRRIETLEKYTLDDLRAFAQKTLGRDNRRRLAVLAAGNSPENKEFSYAEESVDSIQALSSKL